MNTAFCLQCASVREYDSQHIPVTTGWSVQFSYIEIVPRCKVCAARMYVPAINDANVNARLTAFKLAKENKNA